MRWLRVPASLMAVCVAGCAMRTAGPPAVPGGAWEQVRALGERATIYVTVEGSPEVRRWFVSASDSALVVRDTRVRAQAETIPRSRVVQVRAQRPRRLGRGIGGFLLGSFGGAFLGGLVGAGLSGDDASAGIAGMVIGYWAGGITGATVGANGGWRRPNDVIYVRPEGRAIR